MILKAIYDYYQRSKNLAPEGFEQKEIPFIICIKKDGSFIKIEDMRIDKKKSKSFCVVKGSGRTSVPRANVLWDKVEYVLNCATPHHQTEKTKEEKVKNTKDKSKENNLKFVEKVRELTNLYTQNIAFRAVLLFYEKDYLTELKKDNLWKEIEKTIEKKTTTYLSFRLEDEKEIVAEHDDFKNYVLYSKNAVGTGDEDYPVCLITGEKKEPIVISTATKISGSMGTARLVAFQVKSGYNSFGKSQCLNAPISKKAEFAYTTALNRLLSRDSANKFIIGNRTFVFWASSQSEAAMAAERSIVDLFSYIENEDDPNKRVEDVKKVIKAIYSGELCTAYGDRFYILGLAPNLSRIAVVYWNETSLKDFSRNISKHFEDMNIDDTRKERRPYYGIHQMLRSVALQGKVSPNMPEALIKSVLQGTPYPDTLFQACLQRIKAEQKIGITRASIIKAYNNRKYRNLKLDAMLDKENNDPGYLCGRLFATLEYLQERSSGINTIIERYLNAASSTPAAVFPTLLNLSVHHAEKLKREGYYSKVFFEKEKSEIINKISAEGFPSHFSIREQGCFMVGYYHQRQAYYTPKEEKDSKTN